MPKKRKVENDLSRLIKGMGLTITDFAREIGVSASSIKKIAEGKRGMSQELRSRIFAETGVMFVDGEPSEPLVYTKKNHSDFKKELPFSDKMCAVSARMVAKQVELLLLAGARPSVQKGFPIFTALNLALNQIKNEYHLEKHIDAILRNRGSTETRLYTVKELRENDLLASRVGFKDDPNLKDETKIPLAKTVGWLPAKDTFNVAWQNRELINEINTAENAELTKDQQERLTKMTKQLDSEIDPFLPQEFRSSTEPNPPTQS